MRPFTLLVVAALALAMMAAFGQADPVSKALSGPPSEFPYHELPQADNNGVSADSAAYFINFSATTPTWKRTLSVDATQFGMAVYSPVLTHLSVTLVGPDGNAVDIASSATPVDFLAADDSSVNSQFTGTFYTVTNAQPGDYVITVTCDDSVTGEQLMAMLRAKAGQDQHQGMVFLYNDSPDYIFTHLTDYQTIVGKSLGLGTRMYDAVMHARNNFSMPPTAGRDLISDANLEVVYPDGHIEVTPMHDDGLHNDGAANDGEYAATFLPTQPGQYVMQASLSGNNGKSDFIRTTQHFVQVVEQSLQLTGNAFASLHLLEQRVALHFEVAATTANAASQNYRIYAEVYGVHQKDKSVRAAAWVSTITQVQKVRGKQVLTAEVDLAWFAKAGVQGPISLKNAYIQEMATMVPLSFQASMKTYTPPAIREHIAKTVQKLLDAGYKGEITKVMLEGVPPAHILQLQQQRQANANANSTDNGGKLVILHGYCASKNPFSTYPEDWTNAVFYSDPGKGIGVDEYARNVMAFVEKQGLSSFGLVGHSQGGMVSLHIMNYYHTGLDAASGNRKVQSLASPFMGNSAAGSADNMKKLFGLGCGTVNELTIDGATAWLTGISKNAISQLNYYTTQYDKGGLFGNGWCNMVMNTQLDNPNDGATELTRARLNGAINRGHTVGQCHTDGMKWPASYWDHARNAEMNANAAR